MEKSMEFSVLVENFSNQTNREVRRGRLQIRTILLLCLLMAIFEFVMGMLICDYVNKLFLIEVNIEDFHFHKMENFSPSVSSIPLNKFSSPSSPLASLPSPLFDSFSPLASSSRLLDSSMNASPLSPSFNTSFLSTSHPQSFNSSSPLASPSLQLFNSSLPSASPYASFDSSVPLASPSLPLFNSTMKDSHSLSFDSSLPIASLPSSFNSSTTTKGLGDCIAPRELWHSMSDEELMRRASMSRSLLECPYNRTPKVAFMFLAKRGLPLRSIWERFFKGYDGLFSIYLHFSPNFTKEPPKSSVFYKRRIPSKLVQWGRPTMIDAERRLLANALLDFSNERFILLSEACIPVFNFTTVYNYLINSNQSFLSSFDQPGFGGRGRYKKQMWPTLSILDWRKGSQWFEIHRKLAVKIVSDQKYYPLFRDHCLPASFPKMCYADEHYLPTLVSKLYPELNSNRSITWVNWKNALRWDPHPPIYVEKNVSEALLNEIRHGFNCTYNGVTTSICFLFARKFLPSALRPLLRIAPTVLHFDL